jgi:hypothetical protein
MADLPDFFLAYGQRTHGEFRKENGIRMLEIPSFFLKTRLFKDPAEFFSAAGYVFDEIQIRGLVSVVGINGDACSARQNHINTMPLQKAAKKRTQFR